MDDLIQKAEELRKNQDYEESIEILEDLLEKNPNNKDITQQLIKTLLDYGGYLNDDYMMQYQDSIEIFEKILKLDASNYRAIYNIGLAFYNLGKTEEALNSFNRALAINPDYAYCYYNIGLIHESVNNLEKALEFYQKAYAINSNLTYARRARDDLRKALDEAKKKGPSKEEVLQRKKKLKSLLKMSNKIKMDLIQDVLKIERDSLLDILIDWGEKYNVKLDGDLVVLDENQLENLVSSIDALALEK